MRAWVIAVAVGLLVASCSETAPGERPLTDAEQSRASAAADSALGTAGAQLDLLEALGKIDPALNNAHALDRAENVCADLKAGKPAATVQANARARFEGGAVPSLTDEQAAAIVEAVKATTCPQ